MVAFPAKDLTVLLADVRELIVQSREGVARAVDAGLTTLYWHVGQRIRQDILKEKRAGYGEQIVSALSAQLEHVAQGPPSGPAALPAGRVFAAPPSARRGGKAARPESGPCATFPQGAGSGDCRITATTIGLDSLPTAYPV